MPVAIGVWSLVLEGGGPEDAPKQIVPEADVVITNVALGDQVADENSRTTVKLTYIGQASSDSEDEHDEDEVTGEVKITVLCSLTPGKIEQASINVTLEADTEFLLQAVGKNTVYLTGNYIDQRGFDNDPYNDESESEEEDAFALQDVSSDVEINPEDMDGIDDLSDDADRFEEIHDEPQTKSAKRSRESDASEVDTSAKSQKKKVKKQKTENGSAVLSVLESESQHKEKKKEKKDKKDKAVKADGKGAKDDKGVMRELDRGLKVKDITIGTGPQAKTGNTVSMRYIGKLSNGKVFDSNTKGKPFTFKLGRREVIRGWDEGIKGMQVGGERLLIIPADLGYGQAKHGPIPGNSTLTFEVKLIEIR